MNATIMTALEEYARTSPAPDGQCIRVDDEGISPNQAVVIVRENQPNARAVIAEMTPLMKQFLTTNLV